MRAHLSLWVNLPLRRRLPAVALAALLSAGASASAEGAAGGAAAAASREFRIATLSTRPHVVSGGDVLVRVDVPRNVPLHQARITLNGTEITGAFYPDAEARTLTGLVTGLRLGENALGVSANGRGRGRPSARLTLTNYPIEGPITSGPHITPFVCQTHAFRLPDGTFLTDAPVTEPTCSAPTRVTYLYLPVGGSALVPLPTTTTLPADVATTTTTTGATVRFIVRVETSTIDRGIYQSAILHDPTVDPAPSPFAPPRGWNRRLIAVEGFGCPGGWYVQGASIGSLSFGDMDFALLSPTRLGEGYALFSNTLQHPSNNCNSVLAGEAAMMSKERFIETYGVPRYTVSAGCSGGSYGSIQLADALPGLFDGTLIACTFPDPLSIALSGSDGRLLVRYFTEADPDGFTNAQKVAVSGYKFSGPDGLLAFVDAARQSGRTDPVPGRIVPGIPNYPSAPFRDVVPVSERYDPVANPRGVRGTVYDAARNVYGADPSTGFALRPFDNVGVQYGLAALNAGVITPEQFLDLNEGIGGFDQDANHVPERSVGDLGAIRRAYQSGLQFVGSGGLASIPLVDITGIYNDDAGYHYQWFHFATRERMARANGHADNHVMWRGNVPYASAWRMFIAWVEAVAADTSDDPAREKVVRNRPANAVDGCWPSATEFVAEPQTFGSEPTSTCNALFPSYAFPRYVAGGPLAADLLKCQLTPVTPGDYAVPFTPAEWARLEAIFPEGVCDWSRPGVEQGPVVPWGSFGPSPVNLVFDVTRP